MFIQKFFYIFAYMKTTEEFRKELYTKYGKRLIIPDDAEYIGSKKDIKVICPKHGIKWMRPNNLLNGAQCRDCGYEVISQKNSDTPQEFLKKACKTHRDNYDYPFIFDEYGKKDKIHILCKIPIIYIFNKLHSSHRLNEHFNHMYDDALFIEDIIEDNNILLNEIKKRSLI